jgi:Restriction endonuclease
MDAYVPEKLQTLVEACDVRNRSARGAALEDLAEYVLLAIPSVLLNGRDVLDESGTQELDLVFTHLPWLSMVPIPDLLIIVECKNKKRKASSEDITRFGTKLRSRGASIGILVTASGLSGTRGRAGHSAIRDELAGGVAIIVVTAKELATLKTPADLIALLQKRLADLRTYRGYRDI